MKSITYVPAGGWSRRGRDHPRKHHVRSQGLEQARTDPGHAVEPRQTAKQTVLLTPSDDALRERRSDPRQPRDLRHVGAVEVDPFTGEERARQPGSGAGGGAQRGVAVRGCVDRDEPHVARRGGGGRRQRIADPGTRQGQQRKQESGSTVCLFATSGGSSFRILGSTSKRDRSTAGMRYWRASILEISVSSTKPSLTRL